MSLNFSGSPFIDLNVKWWNTNVVMLAKMQPFNMSLSKYYLSSASRGFFVVLNFKNVVVTVLWIHEKFKQGSLSNYSSMYKSTRKKGCTKKAVPKNKTSVCIFYTRFQYCDVFSQYKVTFVKNDLKFFVTFRCVSFRYLTPVCMRFNYGRLALVRFYSTGFSIKCFDQEISVMKVKMAGCVQFKVIKWYMHAVKR